jgi:hypothetical protein
MDFKHILDTCCRVCDSGIQAAEIYSKHTNGFWNEKKTFKCGAVIRWSPNFMSEYENKACPFSIEVVEAKAKIEKARAKLIKYFKRLDIPDKLQKDLLDCLRYYRIE